MRREVEIEMYEQETNRCFSLHVRGRLHTG